MSIVSHDYEGFSINQLLEDTEIAGILIPQGFCNATEMCQANGKSWSNYWKAAKAKSFAGKVSTALLNGSPATISIEGGNDKNVQGTWVHINVAMHLSIWISDDFAIWATDVLQRVINGEFDALTEEAKEAQAKLVKIWDGLRTGTKESFWFIADAVKEYYDLNPRAEKYPGQNYSEVFDKLNLGLFGKKAKQIKSELGITSGLNRDHFGTESLKRIDMIQRIAEPQIKTGKNPVDSVSFALSIMMYEVMDYRK